MRSNNSHPVLSHRPASRRWHRRFAVSSCVATRSLVDGFTLPGDGFQKDGQQIGETFELLAAELRIAELEQALAEAHEAAMSDPLTGALNRRGFAIACRREEARSRRNGSRIALAHIDLDDFKDINDTFGHTAGDRVLIQLVHCLHKSMRPSDVLCRHGGEEFVLMLPDTALVDAEAAMCRFLKDFSMQGDPAIPAMLTFSAGVVEKRDGESLEEALRRADGATYAAKRAGKNRVVCR